MSTFRTFQHNLTVLVCILFLFRVLAQESEKVELPPYSEYKDLKTKTWFNSYGNIRIGKRLFWDAQTHLRLEETKETPFVGQVAQIYNRHAIGYIHSKYFNVRLGGVLRLNFNTDESSEDRNLVPEWRIWHQYQFAQSLSSMMIYHRIRIEHRWTQGFAEDSEYIFRNRWRYMFRMKIPLNSHKLKPKTLYVAPEAELIMQSGKAVVASPMEDLRLTSTLGYILTPRLTVAAGAMYSQGQDLTNGGYFKHSWAMRFHVYYSPDFRKVKNKLPEIHLTD
ncbi:DUF2490 domain-containing protein [Maribacter confluentis]|uniref:DUF2490 domain-containing protein n=2 Tax=Maribacter TaxID=252356 RepID=A0ABY1SGM7_9FLAO|nr:MULTISPECIES: DUF2490 domain-containing protein [Maribacter]MDO1511073.1 DUF2490 domain-containing protein [Maribacter confluentis]SNR46464.1 Protein of unknown function [Maribacter sedimenticola]